MATPTLSYPGVYVVEVPSGVHTITGVATSIGAFFGRATKGPMHKAVRILSLSDYKRAFGKPNPSSDLAQSVHQFFDNGGTDCYVVRLGQGGTGPQPALKAAVTLKNIAAGGASKNVLTATAKAEGLWGNGLRLEVDYNTGNPDDSFNLKVIYEDGGAGVASETFPNLSMNPTSSRFAPTFVTQSSALIDLTLHSDMGDPSSATSFINTLGNSLAGYSQSRQPFVTAPLAPFRTALNALVQPTGAFTMIVNNEQPIDIDLHTLDFTAGAPNLAGVAALIEATINTQLGAKVPGLAVACSWDQVGGANTNVLRITSNSGSRTSVTVRRATSKDLAGALMLGLDQGGIEVARYSNFRPVYNGTVFVGGAGVDDFTTELNDVAGLNQNDVTSVTIAGSPAVPVNLVTTAATDKFYQAPSSSFDGVREKLRIIANKVTADPNVGWGGELWGYHLVFKKTMPGTINDSAGVTTAPDTTLGSGFIANVRQYTLGTAGTSTYQSGGSNGDDGGAPRFEDYVGDELLHTGFHALDTVDIFNLMVLPGDRDVSQATMMQLWGPASIYCQQKRAFLIMDPPDAWTNNGRPVATQSDVNSLRALVMKTNSAVFYPRAQYSDGGLLKYIGPSGLIAGLMSRIDSARGVWKAPAGVEADLRGITDVEVNLTDKENGVLNKLGVNCLRKFPSGFVNWGARTMDGSDDIGSEWKYIPIRRLALFLEESLFRGTKWVVFEPNDEPLWAQVRLNLNAFMMGLFRQGAFQGSTPDKAFYVKCDGETTTASDRNLGIVNIEVGFAPLKPAEFVVIKIQQIADLK